MMMILKRKEVLIGSLILLILVAAFINFNYTSQPPVDDPNAALTSANASATPSPQATASPDGQADETARKMGEAQYVNSNAAQPEGNYFAEARMNKESARSKSMEMLNEMLNNANIDAESKKKAQDDMLALASVTDKEASCENLIKAKGFEECVVFVNGDTASVTVKSSGLSSSDLAKIQEIVSSQTGILIKNIKIVEVK